MQAANLGVARGGAAAGGAAAACPRLPARGNRAGVRQWAALTAGRQGRAPRACNGMRCEVALQGMPSVPAARPEIAGGPDACGDLAAGGPRSAAWRAGRAFVPRRAKRALSNVGCGAVPPVRTHYCAMRMRERRPKESPPRPPAAAADTCYRRCWPGGPRGRHGAFQKQAGRLCKAPCAGAPTPAAFSASRPRRISDAATLREVRVRNSHAPAAVVYFTFLPSIGFGHILRGVTLQAASAHGRCTLRPCTLCRQTAPILYRQGRARSRG